MRRCPGPWAKVILEANFSINQGRQFDRTANIWIGPTNVYFGTTAEPSHNVARHWHVERDLTDYSSIFTVTQSGTVDLGNLVNQTYTSILHGSADILFYPLAPNQAPPRTADQVVELNRRFVTQGVNYLSGREIAALLDRIFGEFEYVEDAFIRHSRGRSRNS